MIVVTHEMQFAREVAKSGYFYGRRCGCGKRNAGGDLLIIRRRRQLRKFLNLNVFKGRVIAVCEDGEERKICRNM